MADWAVYIEWFDDDSHHDSVEADTIEDAAREVYDQWRPTGWTGAAVYGPDYALSIDLEAPEFNMLRF